jgi:hypothetical protein
MSARQLVLLLAVLTTVVLVSPSDAVSCYQCTMGSEVCADPFKSSLTPVSCPSGQICFKIKSGDSVHRHCGPVLGKTGCESKTESGTKNTVCLCDTDKCNSGQQLFFSSHVVLILLLVLLFVNYR